MKTSKMTRLLGKTLLVTTLILLGCSDMKEGIVISKGVIPEHDSFYLMPIQVGKVTTWIPMNDHTNTQYIIRIKRDAYTREVAISPESYHSIKVGQYIKLTE